MLIYESRSKVKKILIAFIVINIIAIIAVACSILLFFLQKVLIGIIAYAISTIIISCDIGMSVRLYDEIKRQEEMK